MSFTFSRVLQVEYSSCLNDVTKLTHITYTVRTELGWIEVKEITKNRHIFSKCIISGGKITLAPWGDELEGFTIDPSCFDKQADGYLENPRDPKTVSFRFLGEKEGEGSDECDFLWVYVDKKQIV